MIRFRTKIIYLCVECIPVTKLVICMSTSSLNNIILGYFGYMYIYDRNYFPNYSGQSFTKFLPLGQFIIVIIIIGDLAISWSARVAKSYFL